MYFFINHKECDRKKKSGTARENTQLSCNFENIIKMFDSVSASWWVIGKKIFNLTVWDWDTGMWTLYKQQI